MTESVTGGGWVTPVPAPATPTARVAPLQHVASPASPTPSLSSSLMSPSGSASLYESVRANSAVALLEGIQASLKQKEGELAVLQVRAAREYCTCKYHITSIANDTTFSY